MARRVKELSTFTGSAWTKPVPIGTSGEYVDIDVNATSGGTVNKTLLQVLGDIGDVPIASQLSTLSTKIGNNTDDITNIKNFINAFTKDMVEGQDNMIDFGSN